MLRPAIIVWVVVFALVGCGGTRQAGPVQVDARLSAAQGERRVLTPAELDLRFGAGLLALLDDALKAADDYRPLVERSLRLARRQPFLLAWHAEPMVSTVAERYQVAVEGE